MLRWPWACKLVEQNTQYCCGLKVFERFLLGDTLEECYEAVAEVANRWLDMLDTQVRSH